MGTSARLILLLLLLTLAIGVWGVSVLVADSARRRELAVAASLDGGGPVRVSSRIGRVLESHWPLSSLGRRLVAAGLSWPPGRTALLLSGAMTVVFVGGQGILGRLSSGILALTLPTLLIQWLRRKAARRAEDFIAQLPELARIIANGNAAGLSVGRCLAMAGRELTEPAGGEMRRVAHQLDLGWGVDQALEELMKRLPSREIEVLVRTIVIQGRTGGALTQALTDIATALDERKQLRREVSTAILGSAVSGYAVMLIGAGAVVMLNLMEPGLLDEMASGGVGRIILIVSFVFFAIGFFLMRVVSRVEI